MTRKALVNTAELMRMAKVAKETGMRIEIEIDGIIIRVAPDMPAPAPPVKKERIRL